MAATSTRSTPDRAAAAAAAIRRLRPPKPEVDPWKAHGTLLETDEPAVTVFLAGAECPFTCSFCDLWRWTIDGPTPVGAIPAQLAAALRSLARPLPSRLKLYNASNFFDRRAVPRADWPAIAGLARDFASVTVESHARMVAPAAVDFARLLTGRLEVAIGLETIHAAAMDRLNKGLDLAAFDAAAAYLHAHDIDLRVFVLLGAPYVPAAESVEWTVRSVEYAAARGAARIAIIPVRGGNGELERLKALGHFAPPSLRELEAALEQCLAAPGRPGGRTAVVADLWDVDRLSGCLVCRAPRVARLDRMNRTGRIEPSVACPACA